MPSYPVDRYLLPLRRQIYDQIPENSSVLDIGCGYGNQLILLSDKVKYGLGIDKSKRKINFARERKKDKLEFRVFDAININKLTKNFDYTILSLILHTLNPEERKNLLQNIPAKNLIIADYKKSPSRIRNFLMHFEELFSGHYKNFRKYLKEENNFGEEINTFDSGIKILV